MGEPIKVSRFLSLETVTRLSPFWRNLFYPREVIAPREIGIKFVDERFYPEISPPVTMTHEIRSLLMKRSYGTVFDTNSEGAAETGHITSAFRR